MSDEREPDTERGRLGELRTSARGWQGIQLAVLGFIGLCGVLKQEETGIPKWLQVLAGIVALAALVIACAATYLVGRAAFPLYRLRRGEDPNELVHTSHRLIRGLVLTFVAVALTALAAASAWWPTSRSAGASGLVTLSTGQASVCGELSGSGGDGIHLVISGRTIAVPLDAVTAIEPVSTCP
jgi:hypothetical protein